MIVEPYKFHSIKRGELQSAKDFQVQIKKQTAKCNFGDSTDDLVCDQIVLSVFDECTRKRLLANFKLTLQQSISTLQIEEQLERDANCFQAKPLYGHGCLQLKANYSPRSNVPVRKRESESIQSHVCYHCGLSHNYKDKCLVINAIYKYCEKTGD